MMPAMRIFSWVLVAAPLCALPTVALADLAPDPDPWEACEDSKENDACLSELGSGYCVVRPCQDMPGTSCLYCDPEATGTTGTATTTAGGTSGSTGTTAGSSSGSTGSTGSTGSGSSGGSDGSSDGSSPAKESGCGCRSDAGPAGALALLGLVGLGRRRRRAR